MAHDAFISYSHTADGGLATALESALQRFAKPWYRIRALSVFRDASNLNLSPDLWNGIAGALGQATHLIYLASPQAAASKWVGKELEFWLTNRERQRLLIVVTDGVIAWSDTANDFDWSLTTCMPRLTAGRFSGEPFYLDLRWARRDTDLSLQNPRFKEAVALLSATLHGESVEDMIGEEVRQHRRTTRIRNAAIGALLTLLVAATAAAIIAARQRTEALHQRDLAVQSSLLNRVRGALESDSLMEAVQTVRESRRHFGLTPLVRQTLLAAAVHPTAVLTTMREALDSRPRVTFSPDDGQILSVSENGVASFAARLRTWLGGELRAFDQVYLARYSPDASYMIVGWPWAAYGQAEEDGSWCDNHIAAPPVTDYAVVGLQRLALDSGSSDRPVDLPIGYRDSTPSDRLRVSVCGLYVHVDDGSGRRLDTLRVPGVADAAFSPDGRRLVIATHQRTSLYDVERVGDLASARIADLPGGAPAFAADSQSMATVDGTTTIVWDAAGRELVRRQGIAPALGPNRLVAAIFRNKTLLWSASAAEAIHLTGIDPRFSADGQWVMTTVDAARTRITDVGGHELTTLDGVSGQFARRAPVVVTATPSGIVRLYDLRRAPIGSTAAAASLWGVTADQLTALAPRAAEDATNCMVDCAFPDGAARVTVLLIGLTPGAAARATIRITPASNTAPGTSATSQSGQSKVECRSPVAPLAFSPATNSGVAIGCGNGVILMYDENGSLRWTTTHDGAVARTRFSGDGQQLLTTSADHSARLWNARLGTELARFEGHESDVVDGVFSPRGDRLATISLRGTLRVWERRGSTWDTVPLVTIPLPDDVIVGAVFGSDGTQVLARTRRGLLHRWMLDGDAWLEQYSWVEGMSPDALRDLGLSEEPALVTPTRK